MQANIKKQNICEELGEMLVIVLIGKNRITVDSGCHVRTIHQICH